MRILLLTDWNPLQGGAEAYIVKLRAALVEAGDAAQLLTADVCDQARQVADHVAPASDRFIGKLLQQVANPFAAAAVRRSLAAFQPQIALVNMFALYLSPSAIFALGSLPYVLLISDYKCICPLGHRLLPDHSVCHQPAGFACLSNRCLSLPHWLREQVRYRRIGEVIRGAAAVLSTSDSLRASLAEQGVESERIYLFSDPPGGSFLRQPSETPLFLFVGRLDEEKGVDMLLRAFAVARASVPESRLRIVGRGRLHQQLQNLAGRLGLQDAVTFCGWRAPHEIDGEFGRAWALVAPSRWPEPFGLVALEAMFRGVPAIVPAFGGMAETVEHAVNGLQFKPADVAALAEQMLEVANSRCFPQHTLDQAVVRRVQRRFSRARHVAQLRAVFHNVLSSQ